MKHRATLFAAALCVFCLSTTAFAQMNYNFSWTTGPVVIATPGNPFTWNTTTANDEEYSNAINVFGDGASFTFAGTAFTQFQASTNGFIRLGTGLASATSADALAGTLRSIIAPLWDNLAVNNTAADITYFYGGTTGSQTLRVSWQNVKWNNTAAAPNMEFSVVLYEGTNIIQFIYSFAGTPTAGSASIGLVDNTVITTAGSATGKFYCINVGGTTGSRQYHESMGYTFNGIANAPDAGTTMTFTPVTPTPYGAGTYHVAGGVPFFSGLSDAAMALNVNGISGPVVLEVADGTYDDIFHLLNVTGASATNTITLKPSSGASVTISPRNGSQSSSGPGITAGDHVIRLDGSQFVTVDGFTIADNSNNTSTVTKFEAGIGAYGSALNGAAISGARFNTLKNLSIDMKVNSGAVNNGATGIRFGTPNSTETDSTKANSYNTIQDVTITGFWNTGIRFFGFIGTNPDRGNKITAVTGRNTVGNVNISSGSSLDIRAIQLDCQANMTVEKTDVVNILCSIMITNSIRGITTNVAGSSTNLMGGILTISDNRIHGLANSGAGVTTGGCFGIEINGMSSGSEARIYNNRIDSLIHAATTTGTVRGISMNLATGTGLTANVYNNMISDLRNPSATTSNATTNSVRGMDIIGQGTAVSTFQVYYNSIMLDNTVPPTSASHRSAGIYMRAFRAGAGTVDLRNNIVINTMAPGSSGTAVALQADSNNTLKQLAPTSDYNLYYVGTASASIGISCDVATLNQTLANHQAAVASGGAGGPRDVNSKSKVVTFVSAADLHLAGGSIGDMDLKGTPIATYTTDIDGHVRDTQAPYMGADERPEAYLPIQLAYFRIRPCEFACPFPRLEWGTLSEVNNYGFYIERQRYGTTEWTSISGLIPGHGTTTEPHYYTYEDNTVTPGRWSYRLKQVDLNGEIHYSDPVEWSSPTGVEETKPTAFSLDQNYPNPFNPSTTIRFETAKTEFVSLKIYDMLGREVATLANEQMSSGRYAFTFNASGLSSGTYIYRLQAGSFVATKKMVLTK